MVLVVISVLSATVAIAASRGALEQRTTATVQTLSEIRSSIMLHRAGATLEATDPFPSLIQINEGALFPSGELPPCPLTRATGAAAAADLGSARSRTVVPQSEGWVYLSASSPTPVAVFYVNSTEPTDRTDPETGEPMTANEL